MKLINEEEETPFQDKTFMVQLSGHELVRMYRLSYKEEAGPEYPNPSRERICGMIEAMFPDVAFKALISRLQNGKVV